MSTHRSFANDQLISPGGVVPIAIKTLKSNANMKTQQDFRREVELMSELRHPNIVCLLGIVTREQPQCMLFEYMAQVIWQLHLTSIVDDNGCCFFFSSNFLN